ncbi:hypothetical protein QFC21_001945 [Naganishia friedmannii]|uniref:Uncharacterized protein n=1 Tax=Naganishia friedmannii TaxID=89922 RepID=A0ACC2VZE5_9TREE|nr:hypothetical protein QFC21_001945 [Naganishia friedmannii]
MSTSIIGNIPIPSLSRFGPPPSEATTSRPAEDIALKYLKHPDATAAAVEAQENPEYSASTDVVGRDPLELRGKILDDDQLNDIRQRKKSGKITQFYEDQNDHIERLLKPMHVLTSEAQAEEKDAAGAVKLAIRLSFVANIVLAGLQLYAAISSLSLSLFATCIDAVFDPFANVLLNILHKRAKNVDEKKWPIGGSRFESILYEDHRLMKSSYPSWGNSNDCFVNAFGIGMSAAGAKIVWWIDPMGAIIIAVCIMFSWGRTIYEQFTFLAGIAAPVDFQQLVIYKAMTFSSDIKAIDSCRVCHSGPEYHVEIDVVIDGETPLWRAHDIAQDLQDQLEALPNINRCFVHIDHETEHKPEHRKHV